MDREIKSPPLIAEDRWEIGEETETECKEGGEKTYLAQTQQNVEMKIWIRRRGKKGGEITLKRGERWHRRSKVLEFGGKFSFQEGGRGLTFPKREGKLPVEKTSKRQMRTEEG